MEKKFTKKYKPFSFLKSIDLFGSHVKIYFHRVKSDTTTKTYHET